jgi:protein required for attachment to host cells
MKKIRTWTLVLDGRRAKILESQHGQAHLTTVECLDRAGETPLDRRAHLERLGRVFDSHGIGRHAIEPRRALGEVEEANFIKEVLQVLSDAFEKKLFDRLVVAAPPDILGKYRKTLPKNLDNAVVETVNKELAGLTQAQLEDYFTKHQGGAVSLLELPRA